jgi:RNA recognition motif-containing protein
MKKDLVYLIGLPSHIADAASLTRQEYLGQYGKVAKVIVNKKTPFKKDNGSPTYSAYVTFSNEKEASICVVVAQFKKSFKVLEIYNWQQAIDGFEIFGSKLNASYGTSRYCLNFLKKTPCLNPNCYFIHEFLDNHQTYLNDFEISRAFLFSDKISISKKILTYGEDLAKLRPHPGLKYALPTISDLIGKIKEQEGMNLEPILTVLKDITNERNKSKRDSSVRNRGLKLSRWLDEDAVAEKDSLSVRKENMESENTSLDKQICGLMLGISRFHWFHG